MLMNGSKMVTCALQNAIAFERNRNRPDIAVTVSSEGKKVDENNDGHQGQRSGRTLFRGSMVAANIMTPATAHSKNRDREVF